MALGSGGAGRENAFFCYRVENVRETSTSYRKRFIYYPGTFPGKSSVRPGIREFSSPLANSGEFREIGFRTLEASSVINGGFKGHLPASPGACDVGPGFLPESRGGRWVASAARPALRRCRRRAAVAGRELRQDLVPIQSVCRPCMRLVDK